MLGQKTKKKDCTQGREKKQTPKTNNHNMHDNVSIMAPHYYILDPGLNKICFNLHHLRVLYVTQHIKRDHAVVSQDQNLLFAIS